MRDIYLIFNPFLFASIESDREIISGEEDNLGIQVLPIHFFCVYLIVNVIHFIYWTNRLQDKYIQLTKI